MTIEEVLTEIDTLKPNDYTQHEKIRWLSDLDRLVKTEIIDTHKGSENVEFYGYTGETALKTNLLVASPYDGIYVAWLESKIDYYNAEYTRYNNSITNFNDLYTEYKRYYNRIHQPKQKKLLFFRKEKPELIVNNSQEIEVDDMTIDQVIATVLNRAFPIGSVYTSFSSTNPADLFGGTWNRIQGRFLLSADSGYDVGDTGGVANNTLTEAHLPRIYGKIGNIAISGNNGLSASGDNNHFSVVGVGAEDHPYISQVTGETQDNYNDFFELRIGKTNNDSIDNMPPYMVVYMWRRTA